MIFLLFAIVLRISLCWYTPPQNSFDNHFEPIKLILKTGNIPAKNTCRECFHPPVFYYVSAMFVKASLAMDVNSKSLPKLLQCINCFYAILSICVIYLILNKLRIPDFSKIAAFGTICFLPRHIYMSAMHSNDAMACLFVSLCIFLLLIAIEKKFSFLSLFALSISITVAIFTKYTALVVIPVTIVGFTAAFLYRIVTPSKKTFIVLILALLPPMVLFGIYLKDNLDRYGNPLPFNDQFMNTTVVKQPKDQGGINFFNFTPCKYITNPIISPGRMHSFWTLIYGEMWFDIEPRYLRYTDPAFIKSPLAWWDYYYPWLRGEAGYPYISDSSSNQVKDNPLSGYTHLLGAMLLTLGLIPMSFLVIGLCKAILSIMRFGKAEDVTSSTSLIIFSILIMFNVAGIIYLTIEAPVFSSMKALYLMNSVSAFSAMTGIGLDSLSKHDRLKKYIILLFFILFSFSCLHIIQICYGLNSYTYFNILYAHYHINLIP